MQFTFLIVFYLIYRLFELKVSKKNEEILKYPQELARKQRYMMTFLHVGWFFSMIIEYSYLKSTQTAPLNFFYFILLLCIYIRYRSMKDLGRFWSIKIFNLPNHSVIKTGIYRWFKYPNYAIVLLEIFFIPYMFGLKSTAFCFLFLKVLFLYFRINQQEKSHLSRASL